MFDPKHLENIIENLICPFMALKNHPKTRNQLGTKILTELRYVFLSFKVKKNLMRSSLIKLNNLTLKLIVFVAFSLISQTSSLKKNKV